MIDEKGKAIGSSDEASLGAVCVSITTSVITGEMEKFKPGNSGYFAVLDRDGLFVLHPDKEMALKQNIKSLATATEIRDLIVVFAAGDEELYRWGFCQ